MATDFAHVGRLLASPARATVVDALLEGRPLPAGQLAELAGVSAPTISQHLSELVDGGLVTATAVGRHRYYQLAGADIAEALEALARICPATPVRSLRQSSAAASLRVARLCYDHLAGVVGVALLDAMSERGWVAPGADLAQGQDATRSQEAGRGQDLTRSEDLTRGQDLQVTGLGREELGAIGVDVAACERARRVFARTCLDWTQRRMHLAGAVGAGLATALLDREWVRRAGSGRGLTVTEAGMQCLHASFGIDVGELRASAPALPG
jgi:DNA-binding transcriptional ArsR family regulator